MKLSLKTAQRLVSSWMRRLEFEEQWGIDLRVHNEPHEEKKKNRHFAAYVQVEEGYWTARMTINAFNISDRNELRQVVIHELVHILLWPMHQVVFEAYGDGLQTVSRTLNEKITERIARVIDKLAA